MDKKGALVAVRPDNIIEARFALTSTENDIIDIVFTQINDDDTYSYEINIDNYKHLYKTDTSNIYRDFSRAAKSIETKRVIFRDKQTGEEISYTWFSKIHYKPKEGRIILNLDLDFKKFLLEFKKKIYYNIKYTINFNCIYSKRLYYYLKSFEDTGWRIDNLDMLRAKLQCPKSYEKFADFRRFVLEPAYEEINGESDINFEYTPIQTGRKITSIKFHITSKNRKSLIEGKNNNELINKSSDESALTLPEAPVEKINEDMAEGIKNVKTIMNEHTISDIEALTILRSSNGDFKHIDRVYKYFKNKKADTSFIGLIISMVKPGAFIEPKGNIEKHSFNDYEQRTYDYDDLEKKLLGYNQ